MKVLLYPMPPFFRFLEGSQALHICLSGRSSMYMALSTKQWWNDSGKRKLAYLEKKETCPSATLSTTILTWTSLVLNPGLRGRSQQITARPMAWPLLTLQVPTSKKTFCLHCKDHILMLLIIAYYCLLLSSYENSQHTLWNCSHLLSSYKTLNR